jgi:hypothetical protein
MHQHAHGSASLMHDDRASFPTLVFASSPIRLRLRSVLHRFLSRKNCQCGRRRRHRSGAAHLTATLSSVHPATVYDLKQCTAVRPRRVIR